jgi:phosphoglycolate phosphatase
MPKAASTDLRGLTIAFDLDVTIVDTAPDLIGSLNVLLVEQGLQPVPTSSARALVGRGARALIERGFSSAGRPLDADEAPKLVTRFLEIYRGRIADESRPFEGLELALGTLTEAGAILCVCTNKPTDLSNLLLEALELRRRFAAVVGADSAPRPKPDASHLFTAVKQAGGDAALAIMVGDSETDVSTARAANVPVIAVPFGYTQLAPEELGADILIQHFSELADAVGKLLPALNGRRLSAIGSPSQPADGQALDMDA